MSNKGVDWSVLVITVVFTYLFNPFSFYNPFNEYDLIHLRDLTCIQLPFPDMLFKWLSCPVLQGNDDQECVFCDQSNAISRIVYQVG